MPAEDAGKITKLRVFDLVGHDVTTLVHDVKPAGRYAVEFDGAELRSGQYIVAVHCHSHMESKLIVVQK